MYILFCSLNWINTLKIFFNHQFYWKCYLITNFITLLELNFDDCKIKFWHFAVNSSIDIEPNQPILVNINQLNTTVVVRNLSVDISYVTCQIHSQTKNLTLSSTPTPGVGKSITGVDLGMVTVLEANQTEVTWYIMSNQSQDVQALVAVFPMSGNGN